MRSFFVKQIVYTILSSIVIISNAKGQFLKPKIRRCTIKEVKLSDNVLEDSITAFIKAKCAIDSNYNRIGYILLQLKQYRFQDKKTVLYSGFFNLSFDSYDDIADDKKFPLFYTYVYNRIVVIEDESFSTAFEYTITPKSKKRFKKKIEPYLPKSTIINFPEKNGKVRKVNFREPIFMLHGGKNFYKLSDGTLVVEDTHY